MVGPRADEGRIPAIDVALSEGDTWDFGQLHLEGTPPPLSLSYALAHTPRACRCTYIHVGCAATQQGPRRWWMEPDW